MNQFIQNNIVAIVVAIFSSLAFLTAQAISMIVSHVNIKRDVKELQEKTNKIETKVDNMTPILIEIKENLASLNTASDFIKVQISALNDRINDKRP